MADWAAYALAVSGADADKASGMARLEKRASEGSALAGALKDAVSGNSPEALMQQAIEAMRNETEGNKAIFAAQER